MRRFLLSLMVLVMFTPGLACAKFMEHQKPKAGQEKMADMPCCPQSKSSSDAGTMLFKDCMKIDLQSDDGGSQLKKVDFAKHVFAFTSTHPLHDGPIFNQARAARAPPDRRSSLRAPYLPVYLSTQRLRI